MDRHGSPRPRLRPVALFALVLAALVGGADAHAPREAGAKSTSSTSTSSERGFLGVSLQDLTDGLRDSYDYKGGGVLISDVVPGSPAAKVGVREGDILLRLDDTPVSSADQVTDRVRGMRPGTLVGVTVVRDGDTKYLGRAEIADLSTARGENGDRWYAAPPPPRTPRAMRVPPTPAPDMRTFTMNSSGRGRLGVETHDIDADLAPYFKTTKDAGVLVLRVLEDTPADRAGLKAGDVITTVGGKAVADSDELRSVLRDREAGDVELRVLRAGSAQMVAVRLAESQGWNWDDGQGNGPWMGWMDGDDEGPGMSHQFHFRGMDDGDIDELKSKLKGMKWYDGKSNDGRVRIFRDLDDLEDMDPRERAEFEQEMRELREEMRELMRDLRDDRDDERDDDDD